MSVKFVNLSSVLVKSVFYLLLEQLGVLGY